VLRTVYNAGLLEGYCCWACAWPQSLLLHVVAGSCSCLAVLHCGDANHASSEWPGWRWCCCLLCVQAMAVDVVVGGSHASHALQSPSPCVMHHALQLPAGALLQFLNNSSSSTAKLAAQATARCGCWGCLCSSKGQQQQQGRRQGWDSC
jgi:hypothetical protein